MESESLIDAKGSLPSVLESLHEVDSQFGLSLLASTLAHEIRNPLQSIRLQIDSTKRGASPQSALNNIAESLTRLESVVNRVQQLSQRYVLHPEQVSLRKITDQTLAALQVWFSATGVTVNTHISWEGEPWVPADSELLQQVLLNVFMNAIQAMPKGGNITVEISEELESAVVEITDSGTGITRDNLTKVATPFFTTKTNGNGLGLSFCKTIAALHGGSLEIDSEWGKGTCVRLRLGRSLPQAKENDYVA